MKKRIALFLALIMILSIGVAIADSWTCPKCGKTKNKSAFCPDCGTARPEPTEEPEAESDEDSDYQVGDLVYFGQYEYSRTGDPEKIRWLVIDTDGDKLFLLAEKGLARHRFNSSSNGATWAESELRYWLNETFLKDAFSKQERKAIQTTQVDDGPDHTRHSWDTAGRTGGITEDKIFLLSYEEMNSLVKSDDRFCEPTPAVLAQNVYTKKHNGKTCCWYWLRTSAFKNNVGVVTYEGKYDTCYMHHDYGVVRPALWVYALAVTD